MCVCIVEPPRNQPDNVNEKKEVKFLIIDQINDYCLVDHSSLSAYMCKLFSTFKVEKDYLVLSLIGFIWSLFFSFQK